MSKRILVVEDQPDNRQIIRDLLVGTDCEITEARLQLWRNSDPISYSWVSNCR